MSTANYSIGPSSLRRILTGPTFRILVGTLVLFAVSPLIATGSLGQAAIAVMFPSAAILALVSLGQMAVIQQNGFDLSIPGYISLSTVLISLYGGTNTSTARVVVVCLVITFGLGLFGLLVGVGTVRFGVSPIIATLGVNTILLGVIQAWSGGVQRSAPPVLVHALSSKSVGIPRLTWLVLLIVILWALILRRSVAGRRFDATGANQLAARVAGLHDARLRASAYALSAAAAGATGLLLSGFLGTAPLAVGNSYLLPTVASVILGGTVLGSGRGQAIGVAIAAVFLSQLDSLIATRGGTQAQQSIIQAVIVGIGFAIMQRGKWTSMLRTMRSRNPIRQSQSLRRAQPPLESVHRMLTPVMVEEEVTSS